MPEQPAETSLPSRTKRTIGSKVGKRLFKSWSMYELLELDTDRHIALRATTGDTREVSGQIGTGKDMMCPQILNTSLHRAASCTRPQRCTDTASTPGLEGKFEQPTDSSTPLVKQKMKGSRRDGRLHRLNVFPPITLVAVDRKTVEVLEYNEVNLPIDPSPHLTTEQEALQPSAGTTSSSGLEGMSKQPAETSLPRNIVRKRLFVARKEDEQRHRKSERYIALLAANRIKRGALGSIRSSRDALCPRPIDSSPHITKAQDLPQSSTVTASVSDSESMSSLATDTSLPPKKKKHDIRSRTRRGCHATTIGAEQEQHHLDSRIALLTTNNNTGKVQDNIRISSDVVDPRPIDPALPREQRLRDLVGLTNNTQTQGFARDLLAVVGARRIDEMLAETGMNREVGGPCQPPPSEPMPLPIGYKKQKALRKVHRDARYDSEIGKMLRGLASNEFGAPRSLSPPVTSQPILLISGRAHDKVTKDSKFTLSIISKEVFCTETSSKFDLFDVEPKLEPRPLNPSAPVFVPWSGRAKLPKRPKTKLERIVAGGLLEVRKDDKKSWFIRAWLDGHPNEWGDSKKKDREDGSVVGQSEICMGNNDIGAEYDVTWLSR